jgi:tryptophanyl-tRNA synthetase
MTTVRKTLVSGIQSSGKLHIGNYFGAIKQNIELGNSDAYDAYIFLADYHSMTSLIDAGERRNNTFDAACTYLAFGLDPEKVTLFKQSDVPEVHELTWILNTVAPMPMLMLAHAFKDHDAKNKDVSVGLFDYPVLMASDILIYDGEIVPVGKDQEQHVEIARELAGKYNRAYGELLKMPQAFIKKDVATVPGIDGEKMSKSKNNHIPLFGSPEDVQKRIMSIVTDSARPEDKKNPDENNIYNIHKLFLSEAEDTLLRAKFEGGGYGYKEAKEELLHTYFKWIKQFADTYDYYHRQRPDKVYAILSNGGEKARRRAQEKMKQVRIATGLDK